MFTDFGVTGPYVGQMEAVLHENTQGIPIVSLMHDAPRFQPMLGAYLLAAYSQYFPDDAVFLCVIDPGVGDPQRRGAIVQTDRHWFVGPDNGLFNVVASRASEVHWWDIEWPQLVSESFHGRDIFAPVAALLASGESPPAEEANPQHRILPNWQADLARIIYIDVYGNCITGIRFHEYMCASVVRTRAVTLRYARTFCESPKGQAFFYRNANGLLEIAVNQGDAANSLGMKIGDTIDLLTTSE